MEDVTIMKTQTQNSKSNLNEIADNTRALLAATAHATEDTVVEARNRLKAALDATTNTCAQVRDRAIASAKATDRAIREKPYHAMGIAFGIGALLGIYWSRRNRGEE